VTRTGVSALYRYVCIDRTFVSSSDRYSWSNRSIDSHLRHHLPSSHVSILKSWCPLSVTWLTSLQRGRYIRSQDLILKFGGRHFDAQQEINQLYSSKNSTEIIKTKNKQTKINTATTVSSLNR